MAKTPFKLKSGNSAPFKQMGSFPMTRSQAARLTQKHGDPYEPMPGESRFQMKQRQRKAGEFKGTLQAPEDIGARNIGEFVSDVKEFGKGLMSIPGKIREKVESDDETVTVEENIDQPDPIQPDPIQPDTNQVDPSDNSGVITDHDANWNYRKVDGRWQTQKKDDDGDWIDIQDNEDAVEILDDAYPE